MDTDAFQPARHAAAAVHTVHPAASAVAMEAEAAAQTETRVVLDLHARKEAVVFHRELSQELLSED